MIEAVLWDLGGVLCRFRPDHRVAAIAARSGRARSNVEALLDQDLFRELDQGGLLGADLHALVQQELGWVCSYDELAEAWSAAFEPDVDVLALAHRLSVPAGLLTDNGPPLADQFARLLPDVADIVDVTVFSADVGYTKPHRSLFRTACQRLGAPPERVLFVDDTAANVAGGRDAGLDAIFFTTASELEVVLRDRRTLV